MSPQGPGYSAQTGLQIKVDFPLGCDTGYVPVQFTFATAAPTTVAQSITVRCEGAMSRYYSNSIEVEEDLEIPPGATSTTLTISVPHFDNWNQFDWEVWVDGRKDDALSFSRGAPPQRGGVEIISVLAIGSSNLSNRLNPVVQRAANTGIHWTNLRTADLPNQWINYSSQDLVAATTSELWSLHQNHPERATALLRWVRSGGNLWVFESGEDWERLNLTNRALGVAGDQTNDPVGLEPSALKQQGWHFVSLDERASQPVESLLEISGVGTAMDAPVLGPVKKAAVERSPEEPFNIRGEMGRFRGAVESFVESQGMLAAAARSTSKGFFAVRAYGMGTVTVFPGVPEGRSRRNRPAAAISQSLLPGRLNWNSRHGVSIGAPNGDFNNWLIPGVGVAPVGGFQLLISLFVIVIGPLNYWLLSRARKLPLLLVTVPAAAAGVTLLLFAYGMLADGFGVNVRARSVTLLDQTLGEAASWSRLTYYAGMAPREGLTFRNDTTVCPITPAGLGGDRRRTSHDRELLWSDGQQHLTRGWLASRTPAQFLVVVARATKKQIRFEGEMGVDLNVTNALGVNVSALAVQDHLGNTYWLDSLAAEEKANLELVEYKTIAGKLREIFTANEPTFPVGGDVDAQTYGTALERNLMESQLSAVVTPVARGFGDGRYIAVTDHGLELELGVDDAREQAGFHVIKGQFTAPSETAAK